MNIPNGGEKVQQAGKRVRHRSTREQSGYTIISNLILEDHTVSPVARLLYILLKRFAWQTDECWPGQDRLAAILGLSTRSLREYLRELEDAKWISSQRRGHGQTKVYIINELPASEAAQGESPEPIVTVRDRKKSSDQDRKNPAAIDRKQSSGQEKNSEKITQSSVPTERAVDPNVGLIIGAYIEAHQQATGARPSDVGRLSALVPKMLANGWEPDVLTQAARLAGADRFGVAALERSARELRLKPVPNADPIDARKPPGYYDDLPKRNVL